MTRNMGAIDRAVRVILALLFITLYITGSTSGFWGIFLLVLAAVFIITSLIGYCPLYRPFHISTKRTKPVS